MNIVNMIEEELSFGELTWAQIAEKYNVPVGDVELIYEEMMKQFDDSMDGDFDSAMTSVGFGTDEDYGYLTCSMFKTMKEDITNGYSFAYFCL